mgnify:CR=1 FL=1
MSAFCDTQPVPDGQCRRRQVLGFEMGRTMLIVAGCALFSLACVADAYARELQRAEAQAKVQSQKEQVRKRRAAQVRRKASAAEEPFCVRPFEYPRKAR